MKGSHQFCHCCIEPSENPMFPPPPILLPTSPNPHLERDWLPKENLNLKGFAQRSSPRRTEVLILCFFSTPPPDWPSKPLVGGGETSYFHTPPHPSPRSDCPTTRLQRGHQHTHLPWCENNREADRKSKWTWLTFESRDPHTS